MPSGPSKPFTHQQREHKLTLGIDLGTTMSCMAHADPNGNVDIIDNRDGDHLTPSTVCYDPEGGAPLVGFSGSMRANTCPENYVYEAKRMIGRGFNHPDVQYAMKRWSFKIRRMSTSSSTSEENDNIEIVVREKGAEKTYQPVQVSAAVLNYLIESAKERLGGYPTNVVVTVPAYFTDNAKRRTLDAATIAFSSKKDAQGNPLKIETSLLSEPTAAAVAYGSKMLLTKAVQDGSDERIFVFDFGGGTFDVSVLDFSYDRKCPVGIVKAVDGNSLLGGADFDRVIIDMAKEEAKKQGLEPVFTSADPEERRREELRLELRLRQEAINAKVTLSTSMSTHFHLACYSGSQPLTFLLSRVQFERASALIFDKLIERCKGVLLACEGVTPVYDNAGYLDYTATAKRYVTENTSSNVRPPTRAEIDAKIESAKDEINRVVMVGGSSRIPLVKTRLVKFFERPGETPENSRVSMPLNADEAVAYGAAYYARAISGAGAVDDSAPGLLLIDQVPLNLNVETLGGVATPVIKARTAVPCTQTQIFSTAADNQEQVDIVVTQGNRAESRNNSFLGNFQLTGIQKAPRGIPQIEVTFSVDQNNVLTVTACDKATGSKQQLTVSNVTNKLSSEEIEKMVKDAEKHANDDKEFREKIEARNLYESAIFGVEDQAKNLAEPAKSELGGKCAAELAWLKSKDAEQMGAAEIRSRMEQFVRDAEPLLKGSQASGPATAGPEVVEVDEQ